MQLSNAYDRVANDRDYIDDRQQDIVLNTKHTNQLSLGGFKDRFSKAYYTKKRK